MSGFNPLAAVGDGYNFLQGIREDGARRKAGSSLATQDYLGAAGALAEEGMLGDAMQLQGFAAKQEAGAAEAEKAEKVDRIKWMLDATRGLTHVPAEQRQQFFAERLAPVLKSMGTPDEVIQQVAQSPMDDASLQAFGAALGEEERKLQVVNRGDGGYDVVDPRDGGVVRSVEPTQDPLERELLQARIDATRAQVGQREAAAAKSRRGPAGRRPRGGSAPINPASIKWD